MTVRSRRVSYISLVEADKSDLVSADSRIVASEELSKEQLTLAQRYVQSSKVSGTLVGAMSGTQAWDVRPLLLDDGQLKLLRFVNPNWILDRDKSNSIRDIYSELATLPWGACLAFGESQGQLWVCRKYFEHTLNKPNSIDPTIHPVQIVQRVITILDSFHEAKIVHGHLCPSNIALDKNDAVLFDFGFSSLDPKTQIAERAPEIDQGQPASIASDIYGLGLIIERFLHDSLRPEHYKLLERIKSREPSLRPGLHEVKRMFALQTPSQNTAQSITQLQINTQSSNQSNSQNNSLGRGRLINGRVYATSSATDSTPSNQNNSTLPPEIARKLKRAENEKSRQIPPELLMQIRANAQDTALQTTRAETRADHYNYNSVALNPNLPTLSDHFEAARNITSRPVEPTPQRQTSRTRMLALTLVMLAGMSLSALYLVFRSSDRNTNSLLATQELESYWNSAQPSLMIEVAKRALDGDEAARAVVVRTALADKQLPKVRHRLLRFAFNSAWEGELNEEDRAIAIGLAVYDLMPEAIKGLMPLERAHPGVILGVVAEMQVSQSANQFKNIPILRMTHLPQPYGLAFHQLAKSGVLNMSDSSAQALAHILVGDYSHDALEHFFAQNTAIKVLISLPLLRDKSRQSLEQNIVTFLKSHQTYGHLITWFDKEKTAEWDKNSWFEKLMISIGSLPDNNLTIEQLSDLLRYPERGIREESLKRLRSNPAMKSLIQGLSYLASDASKLSRYQTISLILALSFKGDVADSFVATWFNTQPVPEAVLELLIRRTDQPEADSFNFEATRYLVNRTWDADLSMMKRLVMHPEPLARALAYARLDQSRPEEFKLLAEMSQIEPNARIRAKLVERIKGQN